jgi:hypothetical protein
LIAVPRNAGEPNQMEEVLPFLNRRQFIQLHAAGLAGRSVTASLAGSVSDRDGRPAKDPGPAPPGFYRFGLGDLAITVLSEWDWQHTAGFPQGGESYREVVSSRKRGGS